MRSLRSQGRGARLSIFPVVLDVVSELRCLFQATYRYRQCPSCITKIAFVTPSVKTVFALFKVNARSGRTVRLRDASGAALAGQQFRGTARPEYMLRPLLFAAAICSPGTYSPPNATSLETRQDTSVEKAVYRRQPLRTSYSRMNTANFEIGLELLR